MTKEWKINQEIYHRLNKNHSDDLKDADIVMTENVIEDALRYFNDKDVGWIYPSKSYVVAICYAYWLSKDFEEDMYELLDDKDLLYNNDPYFIPYSQDKETYDKIIEKVLPLDEKKGHIPSIKSYYEAEFLI